MNPATNAFTGSVVDLVGRPQLLEHAVAQDGHPVAHRHRLGLVVRDVQRRGRDPPLDADDLAAHLHAQLGVQVRERLVHQERRRLAHDRPAHRHALALAARQLPRLALEQIAEAEHGRRLVDAPADLLLGQAAPSSARRPCCFAPSCARTGRSSGTPSRCRGRAAAGLRDDSVVDPDLPRVTSSSPATMRSAVVLPHPDGPTRTRNSPGSTSRLRSFTATTPPGKCLVTPSSVIVPPLLTMSPPACR